MNNHITEDALIKYLFNLEDAQSVEITDHLEQCSDCRAQMVKLKQKFASLDVLADERSITDDLLEKTVTAAAAPRPRRPGFTRPQWYASAAAVLIAATMIVTIISNSARNGISEETALNNLSDQRSVTGFVEKKSKQETSKPLGVAASSADEALAPMPDKPPFAPASAIELNVLPDRESTQLTIYNSADLTLVREKRKLTLKRGWNWLQFMWANTLIDPTSLSLEPVTNKDKIDIQQLVYPARLKDIGRWLIRSEVEGQYEFEITYFTSGVNWRAFYMATLTPDEKKMKLEGYVRVTNNSGEDYKDAQTRLIVGKVNLLEKIAELAKRKHPYNSPPEIVVNDRSNKIDEDSILDIRRRVPLLGDMPMFGRLYGGAVYMDSDMPEIKEIKKEGLSEYFLYTIEGTETIKDKWSKRLPSFDIDEIPVESLYKYNEQMYGTTTNRFISFANDEDHELGETPIPNGSVKVYRTLTDDHLSYEGASNIKYIPLDEDVELDLGPAGKVKVQPKLMNYKTDNYEYNRNIAYRKKGIEGFDEIKTWHIEVNNTTDIDAKIEITRGFNTPCWTMDFDEEAIEYKKHDKTHARFTLTLKPQTKRIFKYTVTTYNGTRTKAYNDISK